MPKKMSRADKIMLTAVIVIVVFAVGFFVKRQGFKPLAILPELDNRIEYVGSNAPESQYIKIKEGLWENDKFFVFDSSGYVPLSEFSSVRKYGSVSSPSSAITKKDFARLKTYISVDGGSGGIFLEDSTTNAPTSSINILKSKDSTDIGFNNYEIIPDNLNKGVYDIFVDGQYLKRITIPTDHVFIHFKSSNIIRGSIQVNYIKYTPLETFSIKNDEVWVEEVRGSSYSFANLNWEMIGYHSEIRPATIRDLTAQTEVPAPQIYINLINNLPVTVQPNTVHTFHYKTKWTQGLDSSCQGQLDKVEIKQPDGSWKCESYVKETPIIQQCQTKADCPILPDCESQKDLISCNSNLCDFSAFSPACKNQLITYQERVIEIENTKFVPIISGTNSFYCFFDNTKTSCNIGDKTIAITKPSYSCSIADETTSTSTKPNECWKTTLSFLGNNYGFINNQISVIGSGINAELSISASYDNDRKEIRDDRWSAVGKFTLPDNFLNINVKKAGNKFVLQNSPEQITFTITNNLNFGINGAYTIQTQNLALEGGVVLRDEAKQVFFKSGDNDITYNFKTEQLGTIVDIIGAFGKVTTDRSYILKSSQDGKEKFLVISKEVKTAIPAEIEKVQPQIQIVEKVVEKQVFVEKIKERVPIWVWWIITIIVLFVIGFFVWKRYSKR